MLVDGLIFIEFVRDRSLITGHHSDVSMLLNYICLLIQILQKKKKTTSDSEPMCLFLEFERLILMSSHYKFRSYMLSPLKIVII